MRWGLVPFWDKSEQPKFAPINARSEEAPAKPMFREAIRRRRALAPADVFYEWQRVSEDRKIPHAIGLRDGEPFFLAAIYEPAAPGRPETYALLTTGPNELMQGIHARMPVILTAETAPRWLGAVPLSAGEYAELCTPFPSGRMRAYPVSSAVNSPRNDSPACLVPAASPGPIAVDGDLFS
jgi:putative SOS response-associated peptidase YedK